MSIRAVFWSPSVLLGVHNSHLPIVALTEERIHSVIIATQAEASAVDEYLSTHFAEYPRMHPYIRAIIESPDYAKPSPYYFEGGLAKLRAEAPSIDFDQCVFVGSTEEDIETANQARFYPIVIPQHELTPELRKPFVRERARICVWVEGIPSEIRKLNRHLIATSLGGGNAA